MVSFKIKKNYNIGIRKNRILQQNEINYPYWFMNNISQTLQFINILRTLQPNTCSRLEGALINLFIITLVIYDENMTDEIRRLYNDIYINTVFVINCHIRGSYNCNCNQIVYYIYNN